MGKAALAAGNYAVAQEFFLPLANAGNADAQIELGWMHNGGQGVPQDKKEAHMWWSKAAKQGVAYAQALLGYQYEFGHGVLQDYVMAHMWDNIASANGNGVGRMYRDGVAKKMTKAEISRALALAKKCMSRDYKKCGY